MKNTNISKAAEISRKLESLALIFQGSAENGDMPSEIYADAFEVLAGMATELNAVLSGVEAA